MRTLIALILTSLSLSSQALDYRSLSDNAIVYDASSRQAKPQFILLKGSPVEQLVALEGWVKIREANGGIGWVERQVVSEKRQVLVSAAQSEVKQTPNESAATVFSAKKDLLLELTGDKPEGAWIKVRHRDGRSGYIAIKTVWGL